MVERIEGDIPKSMKTLKEKHKHLEDAIQMKMNQHLKLWMTRMNHIAIHRHLFFVDAETNRVWSGSEPSMARMVTECRQLQQILDAPIVPQSWETWTAIYGSLKVKMKLVDIIVSCCCSIKTSITPSTRSILEPRLVATKAEIVEKNKGDSWTWASRDPNVTENLRSIAEKTIRLHQAMKKLSSTAETVQHIANGWSKAPIVEFQDGLLPSGEQLAELFGKKSSEYVVISKINVIVGEAQQMMPDVQQPDWTTYLGLIA